MKPLLLALLGLLTVFTSCHKSDEDPALKVPKIKTITYHQGTKVSSESYAYDASGRLLKITHSDGTFTEYVNHKEMIIVKTSAENVFPQMDTLFLNDQGLVSSQLEGTIQREYSVDGKLAKTIFYNSNGRQGSVYDYKASDGNTTAYEIWDMNPKTPLLLITYEYQFLSNAVNTIGNENMGMVFFGKQDKNLVSVMKRTIHMTFALMEEHYLYETDVHNRVVKKWKEGDPGNYYVFTYYE